MIGHDVAREVPGRDDDSRSIEEPHQESCSSCLRYEGEMQLQVIDVRWDVGEVDGGLTGRRHDATKPAEAEIRRFANRYPDRAIPLVSHTVGERRLLADDGRGGEVDHGEPHTLNAPLAIVIMASPDPVRGPTGTARTVICGTREEVLKRQRSGAVKINYVAARQ